MFLKDFLPTAYEKQSSFLSGPRLMMFAEITFCPSIKLEQPVMVLIFFLLQYHLSYGMRYLILSVLTELRGFKMRIQAAFCIASFYKNVCFFKYFIYSNLSLWAMYFRCKCNVWKILVLVITLKFEIKENLHLCVSVTFSRARARTLYCATPVLTIRDKLSFALNI